MLFSTWEKFAELVNVYGFGIAFGIIAAALFCWMITKMVMHLITSLRNKDRIITNHLHHLNGEMITHNERLRNFGANLNDGFTRVVDAINTGFDRQIQAMDNPCKNCQADPKEQR